MFNKFGKTFNLSPASRENATVSAGKAILVTLLLIFSIVAFPTTASAGTGSGCEQDTVWDSPSNPECILEYPAETRVLMGIRFGYYIANCPTNYGAGKDGPVYIKFKGVKPDGILEGGKSYSVEAWFKHDCRDYAGAYDLEAFLVGESGEKIELTYNSEDYHSYTSSRYSSVGQNYCLMFSCGNTYFNLELKVPRSMPLGAASLVVRAHTDPLTNKLGFGAVDSTFNYPNVLTVIAASTPEPVLSKAPEPSPSSTADATSGTGKALAGKVFQNCTALWVKYPGGISSKKSNKNKGTKTAKKPAVSSSLYALNKKMDRDKDGIACER
jgi:hypothetical protein